MSPTIEHQRKEALARWRAGKSLAAIGRDYNVSTQQSRGSDWGQSMVRVLGICACAFVVLKFLSVSAQAESQPLPYAKAVLLSEVIDVLHCPSCSVARMEAASTYYVRTVEGLNVAFAHDTDALRAAHLLNQMFDASAECDKAVYQVALDEYAEIAPRDSGAILNLDAGAFWLLSPRSDLSSLDFYVVPAFRACPTRVASHGRTKWTRHRHGPLISLR